VKTSLVTKLESLCDRHEEVAALLSDAETASDPNKFRALSQEYAQLDDVVKVYDGYRRAQDDLAEAQLMLEDSDPDVRQMAEEEIGTAEGHMAAAEAELQVLMLPKDPKDKSNVFLEIRAGTGGDEAAIFSGDLFRMYSRYAESKRWSVEVISERTGEHGGYKELITRVVGEAVYAHLKFESGAHRVQRVPATESQGRVHTSACTVAVMAEADPMAETTIDTKDLRIDTFRASGAGGQHVNKTDSAIRITHIPTGVVVECQDERSQHKNKARALSLLQARLEDAARQEQQAKEASERKSLVGSGDRSERIRTYNFPQGRVTDHRINLTLYRLDEMMDGACQMIIDPLVQEYQAELLAGLDTGA